MSDVLTEQEENKYSLHVIFPFHCLCIAIHLKTKFSKVIIFVKYRCYNETVQKPHE